LDQVVAGQGQPDLRGAAVVVLRDIGEQALFEASGEQHVEVAAAAAEGAVETVLARGRVALGEPGGERVERGSALLDRCHAGPPVLWWWFGRCGAAWACGAL